MLVETKRPLRTHGKVCMCFSYQYLFYIWFDIWISVYPYHNSQQHFDQSFLNPQNHMKKMYKVLLLCLMALMAFSCKTDEVTPDDKSWTYVLTRLGDFPGELRDSYISFTVGQYGYFGLGELNSNSKYFNDMYKYNPATDTWTQLADFPGYARRNAVCFVIGDFAYVGLGFGKNLATNSYENFEDFWVYQPASDTWTQLGDCPDHGDEGGTAFTVNGKGFVLMQGYMDIYSFNPATEIWTQMNDFPGLAKRMRSVFKIDNMVYACGGSDGNDFSSETWAYNPSSDSWTELATFPGTPRASATSFCLNGLGYLGCGYCGFGIGKLSDFYCYDPKNNAWNEIAIEYPFICAKMACYVFDNKAYLAMGEAGMFGDVTADVYRLSATYE